MLKFAAMREIILLLQRTHAFAQNTSARKITKLAKMEKATKLFGRKVLFQLFSNGLVKNDLGVLLWAKESVKVKISRCQRKSRLHCERKQAAINRNCGDFANVTFANVFGRFANAMSRFANILLVTSPTPNI